MAIKIGDVIGTFRIEDIEDHGNGTMTTKAICEVCEMHLQVTEVPEAYIRKAYKSLSCTPVNDTSPAPMITKGRIFGSFEITDCVKVMQGIYTVTITCLVCGLPMRLENFDAKQIQRVALAYSCAQTLPDKGDDFYAYRGDTKIKNFHTGVTRWINKAQIRKEAEIKYQELQIKQIIDGLDKN